MKRMIAITMLFTAVLLDLTACSPDDDPVIPETAPDEEAPNQPGDSTIHDGKPVNREITIGVGESSFSATLEDTEAGNAFAAMLPMTVYMSEMNGNEKYYNLPRHLPTGSYRPGTIQNGDLMLYGSNCVVLFYKTFSSSYSYTRLGRVADPEGLAAALGNGSVTVTFKANN